MPALVQFTKRLNGILARHHEAGFADRCTGQLEGMGHRIKVIKRMDYRDSAFLFMKIKNVFPGNG